MEISEEAPTIIGLETAEDEEDGNLTDKIEVIKNTVKEDALGTYEVTYQVTDSGNKTTSKTIKVTVKQQEETIIEPIKLKDGTTAKLKARLPMSNEMSASGCTYNAQGSCKPYVVYNLAPSLDKYKPSVAGVIGYWTLTAAHSDYRYVFAIFNNGYYSSDYVATTTAYGVRPVITLSI